MERSARKHRVTAKSAGVRPGKIKKARRLIQDPNYPSPRVVGAVAKKLARSWTRRKDKLQPQG